MLSISIRYFKIRHNSLRDTFAELMITVKCKDVQTEPVLLPVYGLELPKGTVQCWTFLQDRFGML